MMSFDFLVMGGKKNHLIKKKANQVLREGFASGFPNHTYLSSAYPRSLVSLILSKASDCEFYQ